MANPDPPVVVFNYANFIASYPEFAGLTEPQLLNYFDISDAFFANNSENPAFNGGVDRMTRLAYMATAHVAWLMAPRDAAGLPSATGSVAPQTVGQITSASEGSVSVSVADVAKGSEAAAWFAQTRYGFMFWQATAQYRTAIYMANPTVVASRYPLFPRAFGRRVY